MAKCTSDILSAQMEWLNDGRVLLSAISTQLSLVFSLVNESIYNQTYTCRATFEGGMQAEETFTMNIESKLP